MCRRQEEGAAVDCSGDGKREAVSSEGEGEAVSHDGEREAVSQGGGASTGNDGVGWWGDGAGGVNSKKQARAAATAV